MEINVFHEHYDYEQLLLQKEIDGKLNHQDTHICENQDGILIHATNPSHTFALPQFMAEHNCEELEVTDTPSKVPTVIQSTNGQTFNPTCADNPMATQCSQSQYPSPNDNFQP